MNKKLGMMSGGVLLLALTISLSNAYAHEGHFRHDAGDGAFEGMFFRKSHFMLERKQDLGLTGDKVETIKNLMLETEKMLIKKDAEIQILSLEMKAQLHDYPVKVETVNKMVEQQYQLKKEEAQSLVGAIAQLKGTLTKEQNDKLHQLWEEGEKSDHGETH